MPKKKSSLTRGAIALAKQNRESTLKDSLLTVGPFPPGTPKTISKNRKAGRTIGQVQNQKIKKASKSFARFKTVVKGTKRSKSKK